MARGWRDTQCFTFSRLPLLEEKSKLFNLFSDCSRMSCFSCLASLVSSICVGSPRSISSLLIQRKWYMCPVLLGWQRIFCYETRTDAQRTCSVAATGGVRPNPFLKDLHCNHACFSVLKIGNPGGTSCSLCHLNR